MGLWVNRGSKGIAILDSDSNGQARIKYYFDIADTHEGRHARPVPIWAVHPEQEPAIMETLENSFGTLESKENLGTALLSAASNVMEDNFQDYLAQLIYYKEGSFLEPLDEESLKAIFKPLLQNSIGYMLLVRCGIDPGTYFRITDEDLGMGGAKVKFRRNMDAITTLKAIESENRQATHEEQEILSRYVGKGCRS